MYDVLVVGAGLSGQIVANYAAMNGKSVVLLEQNHQTGGNMSGFRRRGFSFDAGDQSFESLGIVFPVLREVAGFGPSDFTRARFRMVSDDFDFRIESPPQVRDALRAAFPNEPGIGPLFAGIEQVSRFLRSSYDPWDFPAVNRPSAKTLLPLLGWLARLKRWNTFRYREKALRVIEHQGLRNWLTNVGYQRMPYLFFAGFWHLWSNDYWYPVGGMQSLNNRIANAFTDRGGDLRLSTRVASVILDSSGRRATGVQTTGGETIEASTIVWAADYKTLVRDMIGEHLPDRDSSRILSAPLTESLVSVYLGLDLNEEKLGRVLGGAQHPFYFPNYDVTFPDATSPRDVHGRMWLALNHFGSEGPKQPPGKSVLTIQTFSGFEWENHWHNRGPDDSRSEKYKELKTNVGNEMIAVAENLVPGLSDHIDYMEVGTPLSAHRFTGNTGGSSGGWSYDDQASPVWRLKGLNRIRTPIPNILCAGHYALWPGGVISAALCGRMVGNMVSGKSMLAPLGAMS